MNVDCSFCDSKYTVSEDLVRGRIARFRCRKCGGIIPVDGKALSPRGVAAGGIWLASGDQMSMPPLAMPARGASHAPPRFSERPTVPGATAPPTSERRRDAVRWLGLLGSFGVAVLIWKALSPAATVEHPGAESVRLGAAVGAEQQAGLAPATASDPVSESDTVAETPRASAAAREDHSSSAALAAPRSRARARAEVMAAEDEASDPAPAGMPSSGYLPDPPPTMATFDRRAAIVALDAAGQRAAACKPADTLGATRVAVTFAPTGKATTAVVEGAPFAGTRVGGCMATMLREATVPPFSGDSVTVHRSF
jgi:hypothetical protein